MDCWAEAAAGSLCAADESGATVEGPTEPDSPLVCSANCSLTFGISSQG
jgi:hypothetical protein